MLSFLHSPTLTSIHDHWKNHSLDETDLVGKVMSLLFNMLSRLVITFLPRSVLISWLQPPSAVILEPPKIKSHIVSSFPCLLSYLHSVAFPQFFLLSWPRCFKTILVSYFVNFPNLVLSDVSFAYIDTMHYLKECYRGHVCFSLHPTQGLYDVESIISDVYLTNWSVLSACIFHGKITVFPFIMIKYCGGDTLRPCLIE